MTKIYLIRHCQAEGNRYRMMQGFWDGDVTEAGLRQLDALAERFRDLPVDAAWSSDLTRALLTAEAAVRGKGIPVATCRDLRELNIGPWEQRFFGNVCHESPELAQTFMFDAENWFLPGAETFSQARERALKALTEIARRSEGKTIVVASHGVTIRCLLSGLTGIPLRDTERLPIFKNTAVTELFWDGERFDVGIMNDVSHLPEEDRPVWSRTGDLRDEALDVRTEAGFYRDCYADCWRFSHGSLKAFSSEPYLLAAERHSRADEEAVLRLFCGEETAGLIDMDPEHGRNEGIGWISLLYLCPAYRDKGYGIQALARAIFFYKARGRRSLQLQVAESNAMARRFYEREGFSVIGETPGSAGPLLLMERPLERRHA